MDWTEVAQAAGQIGAAMIAGWAVSRAGRRDHEQRLVQRERDQTEMRARVNSLHTELSRVAIGASEFMRLELIEARFREAERERGHLEEAVRAAAGNAARVHKRIDDVLLALASLTKAMARNGSGRKLRDDES